MALEGYEVDAPAANTVVTRVRTQREELDGLRDNMETSMQSLMDAAKMRAVVTALSSVWNDMLALQAEAAETRIDNGANGMQGAINAVTDGGRNMMESAQATMSQSPDLVIDDAMVVEE